MRWRQSFATILVGKSILLREGLASILRSANFHILASVSCADDLLASKLQQQQPLFIVVHTGDDFAAAVEQIELFRARHPGGRIAIVADHYMLDELISAFRAGAHGYFVDVMTCDAFIKSMELVMMGETIFPPALSFVLDPEGDHLGEAVPGDENNQAILVTTDDTFAPQLSPREKFRKIRVHNRTQAAIWGVNHGSPTRPANKNSTPSTSDMSKRLPKPVEAISEIRQLEASLPPGVIHEANHLDDRLIRKRVNQRTHGAARLGK